MKLAVTTAMLNPSPTGVIGRCVESQADTCKTNIEWRIRWNYLDDNLGVTGSLQWLYENTTADIIAFLHSDLEIFEQGWDERVLAEFEDPAVGIVGFGGALQLGENDIYRTPYKLTQLRRIDYRSNTRDAEAHGERFVGACDVVTLDGFALIVRRSVLNVWCHRKKPDGSDMLRGYTVHTGWPVQQYPFHNYDNAVCLEAFKQGYRVRLVGIDCTHHGGATATTPAYQQWSEEKLGKSDSQVHTDSHKELYEDGRGILPLRVK